MLRSVDGQVVTGVSGQAIGPIFKGEGDPWSSVWPLKIGPIVCAETPVTNCQSTLLKSQKGEYLI